MDTLDRVLLYLMIVMSPYCLEHVFPFIVVIIAGLVFTCRRFLENNKKSKSQGEEE